MGNYMTVVRDAVAAEVQRRCPDWDIAATPELLDSYALLVVSAGQMTTRAMVHDAWSLWSTRTFGAEHPRGYLVPFDQLPPSVQQQDEVGRAVIAAVAEALGMGLKP